MNPEEYARMHQFEDWYWWFVARREAALQFVRDFRPGDGPVRILDAGCGTGALLECLARERGTNVYGADLAVEALAFSRGRGRRGLVQADLIALPFRADTFDIVTALDVVEHVEADTAALAEIRRVLKPGGILVMSVPAYAFLWSSHDEALHHKRRYTAGMLAPRLKDAGLVTTRMTYLLSVLFPAIALFRLADRLRPQTGPARKERRRRKNRPEAAQDVQGEESRRAAHACASRRDAHKGQAGERRPPGERRADALAPASRAQGPGQDAEHGRRQEKAAHQVPDNRGGDRWCHALPGCHEGSQPRRGDAPEEGCAEERAAPAASPGTRRRRFAGEETQCITRRGSARPARPGGPSLSIPDRWLPRACGAPGPFWSAPWA